MLERYLKGRLVIINYFLIFLMLSASVIVLPLSLPVLSFEKLAGYCKYSSKFIGTGIITWENGTVHAIPQDYADMTGWKAVAELADAAYNQLEASEQAKCQVYAENYGLAGAVQFYGRKYHLPEPICFSDSYLLWAPDSISDSPMIYINDEIGDIDKLFESYEEVGRVEDPYFRENGVMVYLCRWPKAHFSEFYAKKVKSLKGEYHR